MGIRIPRSTSCFATDLPYSDSIDRCGTQRLPGERPVATAILPHDAAKRCRFCIGIFHHCSHAKSDNTFVFHTPVARLVRSYDLQKAIKLKTNPAVLLQDISFSPCQSGMNVENAAIVAETQR